LLLRISEQGAAVVRRQNGAQAGQLVPRGRRPVHHRSEGPRGLDQKSLHCQAWVINRMPLVGNQS